MRKHIGISVLALSAALAVSPAGAASLNLGGDAPLVDLSTPANEPAVEVNLGNDTSVSVDPGNDSGPAISVDTNTDSGDAIDLPDLGDDGAITLDLNSSGDPNDVVVDLGSDPGDDVIVDLFGNPIGSTDGGLLGLGGDDGGLLGDADAPVGDVVDAPLDLGGVDAAGTGDVLADLFGSGVDSGVGDVGADGIVDDIGINDVTDEIGVLDDGVSVGDIGDADGLLGLDSVLGGDAVVDLFGEGGSVEALDVDDAVGGVDLSNLVDLGDTLNPGDVLNPDLPAGLPDVGLPGLNGPIIGDVDNSDDDTGAGINNPPAGPGADDGPAGLPQPGINPGGSSGSEGVTIINGANRATARTRVAQQKQNCFTPNDQQIQHLVASRTYDANAMRVLRSVQKVAFVPVRLCPEARIKVSQVTYNDANIAALRRGIAGSPAISAKLSSAGRSADDVLAVGSKDGQLVVYIY